MFRFHRNAFRCLKLWNAFRFERNEMIDVPNIIVDGRKSSRSLADVHPFFLPVIFPLFALACEARLGIVIVETKRSVAQHWRNVANGTSWLTTELSLHCYGLAIDVAPAHCLNAPDWKPKDKDWQTLGEIGKRCGLLWGGDWNSKDLAHFQARSDLLTTKQREEIILWN